MIGDINIDLLRPNKPVTSQYQDILSSLNLHRHVHKPTRTTDKTSTLIDHIISNFRERILHTDVLPCPLVSDHDAVYATINIKVTRFQTRHKFMRNLKNFDESSFIDDFKTLPFAASFGVSNLVEKLKILSSLIKECIEGHSAKEQRNHLRSAARASNNNTETWEKFCAAHNRLKELIELTKRNFMERMLSSKKSKEVWKVIHRIIHPSPQRITMQPDKLNNFFAPRAECTIGVNPNVLC